MSIITIKSVYQDIKGREKITVNASETFNWDKGLKQGNRVILHNFN